jgi:GDP-4-dehydro-6-deoxy-D-mannose reductase
MRILVAGGTGALGRHVIACLAERGDEPIALARRDPGDLEIIVANLRDYDATRAAVEATKPDAVINLAGIATGDDFEIRATCVGGTVSLLSSVAPSTRVVQVGSSAQYGCRPEPLTEDAAFEPLSAYGRAKIEAEAFALKQPNTVAARPFNLIGPGQSHELVLGHAASQIARAEAGGPTEIRLGDLSSSRDLTDYRDAARALALILDSGEPGSAYNICTGVPVVIRDGVRALMNMSRVPVTLSEGGTPDPATAFQVGDPSRIRTLGWAPEVGLEQSLTDLLDGHRSSVQRS